MNQYILLIHGNADSQPCTADWNQFFESARASGLFKGGSEIGRRVAIGDAKERKSTSHIVGFMRFASEDRQAVKDLLAEHPVVKHGGTVELCDMPASKSE